MYLFKPPDEYFLDSIYNPMARKDGKNCCYWGIGRHGWTSRYTKTDFINSITDAIDHPALYDNHGDRDRHEEYTTDCASFSFHEKALQYVF